MTATWAIRRGRHRPGPGPHPGLRRPGRGPGRRPAGRHGPPGDVLTDQLTREVFGVRSAIMQHPLTGRPHLLTAPLAARLRSAQGQAPGRRDEGPLQLPGTRAAPTRSRTAAGTGNRSRSAGRSAAPASARRRPARPTDRVGGRGRGRRHRCARTRPRAQPSDSTPAIPSPVRASPATSRVHPVHAAGSPRTSATTRPTSSAAMNCRAGRAVQEGQTARRPGPTPAAAGSP